jgi:hypothetical protein
MKLIKKMEIGKNNNMENMENRETEFKRELTTLLNKYSMEYGSNTPDNILSDYIVECLRTYNNTLQQREKWYGRNIENYN